MYNGHPNYPNLQQKYKLFAKTYSQNCRIFFFNWEISRLI